MKKIFLALFFFSLMMTPFLVQATVPPCPPTFTKILYPGDGEDVVTNAMVAKMQQFLIDQKDLTTIKTPTGFYGSLTQAAAKAWQVANGLVGSDYGISKVFWGTLSEAKANSMICASSFVQPTFDYTTSNHRLLMTIPNGPAKITGITFVPGMDNCLSTSTPVSNISKYCTVGSYDQGSTCGLYLQRKTSGTGRCVLGISYLYKNAPATLYFENTQFDDLVHNILTPSLATSIIITSPKTGDVWPIGSTQTITWQTTGDAAKATNAQIVITNGDQIAPGFSTSSEVNIPNKGSYTFTVPNNFWPTPWYKVWLGVWGGSLTNNPGTNSGDFNVVSPITPVTNNITIQSPNGGDKLPVEQNSVISWKTTGFSSSDNVDISLQDTSIHCAQGLVGCWSMFPIATVKNSGSYTWDTNTASGDAGPNSIHIASSTSNLNIAKYKIVLNISGTDGQASSSSAAPFSVIPDPGTVSLVHPNKTDTWTIGQPATIDWTATGGASTTPYAQLSITNAGILLDGYNATSVPNTASHSYTFTVPASWQPDQWYHVWVGAWQGSVSANPGANSDGDFTVLAK